jgi:hypothetical protein
MATAVDTALSLITGAEALEYLGSTGTTGDWYRIYDLVNVVASRMNSEAGRALKASTYTEYYDGDGGDELILKHYPLTSTDVVIYVDETRAFTDTDYQVSGTDVLLDTEAGIVRLDGDSLSVGERNVRVQYSAGYSSSGSDYALFGAAKEYLQLLWQRASKRDTIGLRTESFEGGSRTYENDLPWSVKQVLQMYKDRRYS